MIANIIGGLLLIAAGFFPLYFKLNNWWWIAGGVMIVWGAMIVYSGCRYSCLLGIGPDISDEELKKLKEANKK